MLAVFSVSIFAESGFEVMLNIPIGLSLGMPAGKQYKDDKDAKVGAGFDIGVSAQLGYMFSIKEGLALSILGEIGYAYDTWAILYKGKTNTDKDYSLYNSTSYHSLQIGILPKININQFSIGIGGGIKIPFSATQYSKYTSDRRTEKTKENYNFKELTAEYPARGLGLSPAIIGYVKAAFDYSIFFTDNTAISIGLYLAHDFMPSKKARKYDDGTIYKDEEGTFDIGLQLGFKLAAKN
ncbi:PorT family protein [uncultured Brachyspira sp.]|nr:PorT family protein [uncultured Brachyspira sp.]